MTAIELEFLKMLEGFRGGFLDTFFEAVTMLGEETLLILLAVTLWFAFDKRIAQKFFFLTSFSLCVNGIIKNFVARPRPFATGELSAIRAETATGFSFPSGHTQNVSTWITLFALLFKRFWFYIITAVLILLVAFSRMFLGAHYPSDVIVGGILGICIAVAGSIIFDKVKNKKKLYIGSLVLFFPFAVTFMFLGNPHFADFYKIYGLLIGMLFAVMFEERFAPLTYDVGAVYKIIRIVIGVVCAILVKDGLKLIMQLFDVFEITNVSFIGNCARYALLVFAVFGLCPLLFKKFKI